MAEAGKKKKIFDGRYEILNRVGRGARSVVYHARYTDGDQEEVALKVILDKKDGTPPSDLLRKEALAMVSSRHKYVIRLDDFHSLGDLCYLTMEYAKLGDLRKFLEKKGGKLSLTQIELFLLQAGEALDFIHKAGILHRDLKPENILVIDEQNIRIGDFGVAILPGEKSSLEELQKGVGTLDYLSPEVLEGNQYDKRSDLYALGVSFYELLTGRNPFEKLSILEQVEGRREANFTSISEEVPDAPGHLLSAVTKLLAFDPNDRFQSARELIQALISFDVSGLAQKGGESLRNEKTPLEDNRESREVQGLPEPEKIESTPSPEEGDRADEVRSSKENTISIPPERDLSPSHSSDQISSPTDAPDSEEFDDAREEVSQEPSANISPTESNSATGRGEGIKPKSSLSAEEIAELMPEPGPMPKQVVQEPIPTDLEQLPPENEERQQPESVSPEREPQPRKAQTEPRISKAQERLHGRRSKDRSNFQSIIPFAIGGAIIIGCIYVASTIFSWLFAGSPESPVVDNIPPVNKAPETVVEERRPAAKTSIFQTETTELKSFPNVPGGVYSGSATFNESGESVPFSLISIKSSSQLIVAVGIPGLTPIIVDLKNLDTSTPSPIRVASQGLLLSIEGIVQNDEIQGTLTNEVTGEVATWRAKR